jgi:hypothetical protein
LARRHGLGAGTLTNTHALELAHVCACRVPSHAHAFARGKRTLAYLSFPSTELGSPVFHRDEPRRRPPWCLFAWWCESRVILEPARTFSCARVIPCRHWPPQPRRRDSLHRARVRHVATPCRPPEPEGTSLARDAHPSFFLCVLTLVLTHACGRRGQPNLAIADSTFATAPAMVSTLPRQLSPLQGHTFLALANR